MTKIAVDMHAQFFIFQSPIARINSIRDISIVKDLAKPVASLWGDRRTNAGKTVAPTVKKTAMTVTPLGRFILCLHVLEQ